MVCPCTETRHFVFEKCWPSFEMAAQASQKLSDCKLYSCKKGAVGALISLNYPIAATPVIVSLDKVITNSEIVFTSVMS